MSMEALGLSLSISWSATVALAVAWLVLMMAFSPLADAIATRLVAHPPRLGAFQALQQSRTKLILGIVVAWVLGACVEELVLRGVIVQQVAALLSPLFAMPIATAVAIGAAAVAAFVIHLYQGLRAALIIAQLSVLFGALFVVSGYNLWAVILCHGFYDTIAFVRFATRRSKYAKLGGAA
jgi:CAAX protease family protein